MKRLFLGSVALVALGLGTPAALAAEMALPAPALVAAPVYANWSGCYAGGVAGTTWGGSDRRSVVTTTPGKAGLPITDNFNLSGFTGGFDAGCNWQVGGWVFGAEGDWSADNKSGQAFGIAPFNPLRVFETQERWVATARGRIGWTWWDKTLVYVTGGAAWTKVDNSEWSATNPIGVKIEHTFRLSGWVVGAGLEYALGYGWSARGEYLYEDFGTNTSVGCINAPQDVSTFRLYNHVVRAGLNYKFW
jgi:outer membrane immunogenic protein